MRASVEATQNAAGRHLWARSEQIRWRPRRLWALSPALLTIAIVVAGQVFQHRPGEGRGHWALTLVYILFFAHIPITGLLWRVLPEARWAAVMTAAISFVISIPVGMFALMSISGDWL